MKILLVHGANLTFLGRREPAIYGTTTAAELDAMLQRHAREHGYVLDIFYNNIEGEAINHIYRAVDEGFDGLVMNRVHLCGLCAEGLHQGGQAYRTSRCISAILPNAASTASPRTWPGLHHWLWDALLHSRSRGDAGDLASAALGVASLSALLLLTGLPVDTERAVRAGLELIRTPPARSYRGPCRFRAARARA
jgi:hypothetical protein